MNNEEKIMAMLEALAADVSDIKEEQRGFREELQEIKAIQLRMENEHGEKLDALFDGYKLLYDVVGEVRADVAFTKSTLAKHDLQIRWTDSQRKTS